MIGVRLDSIILSVLSSATGCIWGVLTTGGLSALLSRASESTSEMEPTALGTGRVVSIISSSGAKRGRTCMDSGDGGNPDRSGVFSSAPTILPPVSVNDWICFGKVWGAYSGLSTTLATTLSPFVPLPFAVAAVSILASAGRELVSSACRVRGFAGAVYTLLTKPPGSTSVGWSSWSSHTPSTMNLYLIFCSHGILMMPSKPDETFTRCIDDAHLLHERRVKDTARLRTDLVECTGDNDRGRFGTWPIER